MLSTQSVVTRLSIQPLQFSDSSAHRIFFTVSSSYIGTGTSAVFFATCGADTALPDSKLMPSLSRFLSIAFWSKYFVIKSAGCSVPSTFSRWSRRVRIASWIQSAWQSRWRTLPRPLRCAIPIAAVAST